MTGKPKFEPRIVNVGDEQVIQLSPEYFQKLRKDTPNKTGLQKTLENLQADLDSGRLTQEEYDIATKNARDLYIGLGKPKGQTSNSEFQNIMAGAAAGDTPTGDATPGNATDTSDTVQMIDREGKLREVPKVDVGEAVKNGYTPVGQTFTPNI